MSCLKVNIDEKIAICSISNKMQKKEFYSKYPHEFV